MIVREAEWLSIAHFAYLGTIAVVRGPARARSATLAALVGLAMCVALFGLVPATMTVEAVRAVLPLGVLLLGYRVSGTFFERPMVDLERALLRIDSRLLARLGLDGRRPLGSQARAAFELAYFLTYPVLPLGAAVLADAGHWHALDRFWTIVLAAGYACYGMLPWIQTRPPRALEGNLDRDETLAMRKLNLFILSRGSIGVNTLPSGHAATVVGTALAIWPLMPRAGFAFAIVAAAVCAATVVGRYHYAIDTILGILVAFLAAIMLNG